MTGLNVALAVNCGSSSVKLAVFDASGQRLADAEISGLATNGAVVIKAGGDLASIAGEMPTGTSHAQAIGRLAQAVEAHFSRKILGIGHRIVHGGGRFSRPVIINDSVMAGIDELASLAPLHQPHNIAGIRHFAQAFPDIKQVACFDTAFHLTVPEVRRRYALPDTYAQAGLLAYGFHGLACQHAVESFEPVTGKPLPRHAVIAHLGNGASVTSVRDGQSQSNSMGFTPLDGLMMGQRCGHLDPGAVLWLVERHQGDIAEVSALLNRKSGLLGVSGETSDMQTLLASQSAAALRAVDMFVDRICREVASAAAAAGGMDALIFTGGIGWGSALIRARVIERLSWLGFDLSTERNDSRAATITSDQSPRSAHVIRADEERVIVAAVHTLLA